jgi:hypothetical protein
MMKKLISALLVASCCLLQPASAASAGGVLKSAGGIIVGTFYGAFLSGPVRGSTDLGIKAANGLTDMFGGGTFAKAVGYPVGAFAGGFVGGFVGMAKGAVNGVYYGIREPFSERNLSLEGEFQDFDSLDFNLN